MRKQDYFKQLSKAHNHYLGLGFTPIPAGSFKKDGIWDKKKPPIRWSQYRDNKPMYPDMDYAKFASGEAEKDVVGIGLICGSASGGLEVIDCDMKNDPTKSIVSKVINALERDTPDLYKRMPRAMTASGGWHLYYRVSEPFTQQKLLKTDSGSDLVEIITHPMYIRVAPSLGYVAMHDTSLSNIPTFTVEERDSLVEALKTISLEDGIVVSNKCNTSAKKGKNGNVIRELTEVPEEFKGKLDDFFDNIDDQEVTSAEWVPLYPSEAFNDSIDVLDIAKELNFTVSDTEDDVVYVKRPAGSRATTAPHSGSIKNNTLWLWSGGDSGIPEHFGLAPMQFWMLNKGISLTTAGFRRASKLLEGEGYGTI